MAKHTKNYNLIKPETTDFYDVEAQHNTNMDKIDLVLKNNSDKLDKLKYIGNRNLLINGCFDVWQRGTSFIDAGGQYTADKWYCSTDFSSTKISKDKDFLKLTAITSGDNYTDFAILQGFKTINVTPLKKKKVTFSVDIKKYDSMTAGDVAINIYTGTGIDELTAITGRKITTKVIKYADLITTPNRYFVSADIPEDATSLCVIVRTGKKFGNVINNGGSFGIKNAKLEMGEMITPIEKKSYIEELRDCQNGIVKNKNLLINGCFDIWQRGTSVKIDIGQNTNYLADKWRAFNSSVNGVMSKLTAHSGAKITRSTGWSIIAQKIENFSFLEGQTVTVSAKGSNISVGMVNSTNYQLHNPSAVANDNVVSTTFTVPKGLTYFGVGINTDVDCHIEWVKLELGEEVTPIERKSYAEELRDCQNGVVKNKNLLINSCFDIWQKNSEFIHLNQEYGADKWRCGNHVDVNIKLKKDVPIIPDFNYSLRLEQYLAVGGTSAFTDVVQKIDDYKVLLNKASTFTVQVKADVGVEYRVFTMSVGVGVSFVSQIFAGDGSIKTHSISGICDKNAKGVEVYIRLFRNGLAIGKGLNIQSAKLELGKEVTPIERKSYAEELRDCQNGVVKNKNLLINGCFDIWQRGTSFNPVLTNGSYTADKAVIHYGFGKNNLIVEKEMSEIPPNKLSKQAMKLTYHNEADGMVRALIRAEELNIPLNMPLKFSFWAKVPQGLEFLTTLSDAYATTHTGSGKWEKYESSVKLTNNNSHFIDLFRPIKFEHYSNKIVYLAQCKLEIGDIATPIEHRTYIEELRDCQSSVVKNKNLLINGCFDVWQRGTNFANLNGYTADRWKVLSHTDTNHKVVKKENNCLRLETYSSLSNNSVYIVQPMEAPHRLKGKTVTLTLELLVDEEVNCSMYIYNGLADLSIKWINVKGTKTFVSNTIKIPDNSVSVEAVVAVHKNNAPIGKGVNIYSAKLEISEEATPIERKTYAEELRDCQRYFEKSYNYNAPIGKKTEVEGASWFSVSAVTPTLCLSGITFSVPKRISPTIKIYSPSTGAVGKFVQGVTEVDVSTTVADERGMQRIYATTNMSAGTYARCHWTADAEI